MYNLLFQKQMEVTAVTVDSDGEKDRNQGIPPLQLILQPLDK
jgi:hypothetical protein